MFKRPQHQIVLAVLESFRPDVLAGSRFLFGGGTRIVLDLGVRPDWSPVDCLSLEDCFAEKILANSDRWADRQILSRDLIDLAALRARLGPIPEVAWEKVRAAYRTGPVEDLLKALTEFGRDPAQQRRCFDGLQVGERKEEILRGLALLHQDLT